MPDTTRLQRLNAVTLTLSPWLPAPSDTFRGWLQISPAEFVVHPDALAALEATLLRYGGQPLTEEQTEEYRRELAAKVPALNGRR